MEQAAEIHKNKNNVYEYHTKACKMTLILYSHNWTDRQWQFHNLQVMFDPITF